MSRETALRALADQVVREIDEAPLALDEATGLERLRSSTPRASNPWPRRAALVGVALAAMAVLWASTRETHPPLSFQVERAHPAAIGEWIAGEDSTALTFSDGTRLDVAAGARVRVASVAAGGAAVELDRGTLDANVHRRPDARWTFSAGPYEIEVTGTAFTLRWDPEEQALSVEMREGSVRVSGPRLSPRHELRAPDRLDVRVEDRTSEAREPSTIREDAPAASVVTPATTAPTPAPSKGWRHHDAQGHADEAIRTVERRGVTRLAAEEDAAGLLRLAQLARLKGNPAASQRFLAALRSRFPDTLQAQTATYLAARSHHDAGRHAAAATELQAYLTAAPGGPFAREAQVLLIVSLHELGDPRAANLARAYLAKHGEDVHAPRVRQALPSP